MRPRGRTCVHMLSCRASTNLETFRSSWRVLGPLLLTRCVCVCKYIHHGPWSCVPLVLRGVFLWFFVCVCVCVCVCVPFVLRVCSFFQVPSGGQTDSIVSPPPFTTFHKIGVLLCMHGPCWCVIVVTL